MIDAIISGLGLGLLLSILIGPVFFLLIKTSIYDGFKSAMFLELGIGLSDVVCIAGSYFGLVNYLQSPEHKFVISIIGGIVLIIFGLYTFNHKTSIQNKVSIPKRDDYVKLVLKGFVFNISNPSVIFFWIGAVSLAVSQYSGNAAHIGVYFLSTLSVVTCIDIVKARLAQKLSTILTEEKLNKLSKFAGIAIMSFGVVILLKEIL
jgi:threonine/homoserine/homoserine lactone efflux protein